jgi:hypothetical protein
MSQFDFVSALTHITNLIEVALLQTFLCVLFAIKLWKLLKKELDPPAQTDSSERRPSRERDRSP